MFIEYVLNNKIVIYKQKKEAIIEYLIKFNFPKLKLENKISYDSITTIPLFSLTIEKINELKNKLKEKEIEYNKLFSMSEKDIWKLELKELKNKYLKWNN